MSKIIYVIWLLWLCNMRNVPQLVADQAKMSLAMSENIQRKHTTTKDRMFCSSCKKSISGAAVKAGGNFWHKVGWWLLRFFAKKLVLIFCIINFFCKLHNNYLSLIAWRHTSAASTVVFVCDFQRRRKKI